MRFFADECIIYRKILNIKNVEKLQTDMNIMEDWAEGNEIKINPNKCKSLSFTRTRVKDPIYCSIAGE